MKQKIALLYLILFLILRTLVSAPLDTDYHPSDLEVKVALQGLIVASSASLAATLLVEPIKFQESQLSIEGVFASGNLKLERADVATLREAILKAPKGEIPRMGLLEMLRSSVNPFGFSLAQIVSFLELQQVLVGEIIYSGELFMHRDFKSFPFRYDVGGVVEVSGSRFANPFILAMDLYFPFEGIRANQVIPRSILANNYDYLHVGQALFGQE